MREVDIVPVLPQTFLFMANWAIIAIDPDPSVTEGGLWKFFDKMAYRHENLGPKGLRLKAIFLVVRTLFFAMHEINSSIAGK